MGASKVVVGDLERLVQHVDKRRDGQVAGVLEVFIGDVLTLADQPDPARADPPGPARHGAAADG